MAINKSYDKSVELFSLFFQFAESNVCNITHIHNSYIFITDFTCSEKSKNIAFWFAVGTAQ